MLDTFQLVFKTDERQMKALTGLNSEEFSKLSESFEETLERNQESKKTSPKRAPGGGAKHTLKTGRDKLFFILFYLKVYPTYDVIAAMFGVDRSQVCRWVQEFMPVLTQTLEHEAVLPLRKIESYDDFITNFPETDEVYIDGTERPTQRSSNYEEQKEHFSGKKKGHKHKNIVISDAIKRVVVLGDTQPGKNHDYSMFKKLNPQIPSFVVNWVDLGFQGIEKDFPSMEVVIPNKKPRGKELTAPQKAENTMVARVRILSEHAIGGIKRLKAVTDTFRNRIQKHFADSFMLLACGLWNFHLKIQLE